MKQWWRAQWRWLVALPVSVAAALYFASGRLTGVYWQDHPTQRVATVAGDLGPTAHYTSSFTSAGTSYDRAIHVTFTGAHMLDSHPEVRAVTGAQLWGFDFSFSADPAVIAQGCHVVALDEQGRKYFEGAAQQRKPDATTFTPMDCVPPGAQGPSVDAFTGQLTHSAADRPDMWQSTLVVALPDGVSPAAVQLYWDLPRYAQFSITP